MHWYKLRRRAALLLAVLLVAVALPVPARAAGLQPPGRPAPSPQDRAGAALTVSSPSAVLMEARSGKILYEKNAHARRHPASVTKIMTLLMAYDAIREGKARLTDEVTTSAAAASLGGTTAFLEAGEVQPLSALLKAVAVGSANDASVAVAEHLAGSHEAFVALMNARARELGLENTHFVNAHGFDDPNHYSSAHDLAVVARVLVNRHPEVLQLAKTFLDKMSHPDGRETELLNRNRLVRFYNWVDGLKTGWTTQAGYSVAVTGQKGGTRMIAVILGAPNAPTRQAESLKLLEYGFAHYNTVVLAPRGQELARVPVRRGAALDVAAVPDEPFAATLPKGETRRLKYAVTLRPAVFAPVAAGQPVGEAVATVDGVEVARVTLVAGSAVPRLTLWGSLGRSFGRVFSLKW